MLREIASTVGTPTEIDAPTKKCGFGHYARILVDNDLSKRVFDEILVDHEGFAFMVEVQYERWPDFCLSLHQIIFYVRNDTSKRDQF